MENSSATSAKTSVSLALRFRSLCDRYAELVNLEGFKTIPYPTPDLPFFSSLDERAQQKALHDIEQAVGIYEDLCNEGYRLTDTPQLLWRNLSKLGYVCESDIFDKITPTDVVQVFSFEGKLVIWNLRLLGLVSFTIEQLFCTPWWLLGKREPDVSDAILAATASIISGKITNTFNPMIPVHVLTEANSDQLLRFKIGIKYLSPLRKNGVLAAFIAINSADPV
jgi:hypothetical protein